jgi:hypothetical protein
MLLRLTLVNAEPGPCCVLLTALFEAEAFKGAKDVVVVMLRGLLLMVGRERVALGYRVMD